MGAHCYDKLRLRMTGLTVIARSVKIKEMFTSDRLGLMLGLFGPVEDERLTLGVCVYG